jgi:hypothetical protein
MHCEKQKGIYIVKHISKKFPQLRTRPTAKPGGYIKPSAFPASVKRAELETPLNVDMQSGSEEHSASDQDPDESEEDEGTKISRRNYRLTHRRWVHYSPKFI